MNNQLIISYNPESECYGNCEDCPFPTLCGSQDK